MFAPCFNFEASCARSDQRYTEHLFPSQCVVARDFHFSSILATSNGNRQRATPSVELAMEKRTNTEEERWRRNSNMDRKLLVVASARAQLTKGGETRSFDSNGERHRLKWRSYRANRASRVTTCGAERESDIEIPSRKASSLVDFRKL